MESYLAGITIAILHLDLVGPQRAGNEEKQREIKWRRESSYERTYLKATVAANPACIRAN